MPCQPRHRLLLLVLGAILVMPAPWAIGQESATTPARDPRAFAPLEFLIGSWKGPGVRKDDPALRFKGWTETHTWAWVFAKGKPVGMSVTVEGGKILEKATLTFDEKQGRYWLESTKADGRVEYAGLLDSTGKLLTLSRRDKDGQVRLTLRANSNYVRYTMRLESKDKGSAIFTPMVEVGLTKEGESFAAGSNVAERPRCIVTGGRPA